MASPRLLGRTTVVGKIPVDRKPRDTPKLHGLCKDRRPPDGGDDRPYPPEPARSSLLASFDAADRDATKPMFPGGPAPLLFTGVKRDAVRAFFRGLDQLIEVAPDVALTLSKMCMGHDVSADESMGFNQLLEQLLEAQNLEVESVSLPAHVVAWGVERVSPVKFYPARFGALANEGICTWKKGKNGLSVKIKNAFAGRSHQDSPLCIGAGAYVVLEFVIEWTGAEFRLNVVERDANGGSRHSSAAIKETISGRASKYIVDAQLFLSDDGSWLPRTCLAGPMLAKHGDHVKRRQVLQVEKRWGDGSIEYTHYWDMLGAGGHDHALVRSDGRLIGIPADFARDVASTPQFRAAHPDHELVELPRDAGRGL